ncbi:MAG: hypothetical protein FI707_11600 [SAR202 cluster bacterium]|jgi:hypothetical protein|nr:hypothetical protein [SAR202 cluster bacterium]MQG69423.1 hypothetical protein [SAR202 cluster bacterium]HAL46752.1 hypothetical protein [Dehalococcoidia bacterium]|tara:strand:+ start:2483 stop:2992 length:510 start_codon:yes stop_codon:yes gene_type:complete
MTMLGNLNTILPEPVSDENEEVILDLLKRKVKGAAEIAVLLLNAMEERFGPEAREVVRQMGAGRSPTPRENAGEPESDLQEFCAQMEKNAAGSHTLERVTDEPDRIGYLFTRCLWAEAFLELGERELGLVMCASDKPTIKSHNPRLGFARTKMIMNGDDACDHVFFVEK